MQEFYPLGMPWVQFVLATNVLESLVIQMQNKQPRFKAMTPIYQGPHNLIEFFFTGAIVTPRAIKLLIEIGNGPLGLD